MEESKQGNTDLTLDFIEDEPPPKKLTPQEISRIASGFRLAHQEKKRDEIAIATASKVDVERRKVTAIWRSKWRNRFKLMFSIVYVYAVIFIVVRTYVIEADGDFWSVNRQAAEYIYRLLWNEYWLIFLDLMS